MGEAEAVVAAMTALMQDCTECIAKMMGNTSEEAVAVVEEAVSLLNSVEVAEVGAEDMKNLAVEAAEAVGTDNGEEGGVEVLKDGKVGGDN